MARKSTELWKTLKVGDRVRLVEIPAEFFEKGYYIHKDTMRVYKKLHARRHPLRVHMIDEYGFPWIMCMFRRKGGRCEWHYLAFNILESLWSSNENPNKSNYTWPSCEAFPIRPIE